MSKRKRRQSPQITELRYRGQTVGFERWELIDGYMRARYSETLDGPAVGIVYHDQRVKYRTAPTKTTGDLTGDKYYESPEIDALFLEAGKRSGSNRGQTTMFILTLLIGSGIRASELCGLRVADTPFVLNADQLRVMGKGSKLRPVPILPELSEYIAWYIRNVRRHYVRRPMKKRDWTQPLILTETGRAYDRKLLWKRINRIGKRAGLEKMAGVHRCRHSYGTHGYRSGIDIVSLQRILGHVSVSTTQIYARCDPSKAQEMLRKVDILSVRTHSPK